MADYTLDDVKKYIENELSETPCYNNVEIGDVEVNGYKAVYVLDDNRLIVIKDWIEHFDEYITYEKEKYANTCARNAG